MLLTYLTGLKFDDTITLGNVIQLVILFLGAFGLYVRMKDDINKKHTAVTNGLTEVKTKVDIVYDWFQSQLERRNNVGG